MKKLTTIALFLVSFSLFSQSPWTKKKGAGYLQVSFTTISNYNTLFGDPEVITQRKITDNTLQAYGEYGLTDKTTLLANIPFKFIKTGDAVVSLPSISKESISELGNIQLGVKHNFIHKKWLLTGQFMIEANTSSYDTSSGLRTSYDAWTFTPLVITGRSFDKWYVQAFTGFDIRTNGYSSNYKLGGEVGYKAINWLWIAGFLDGVASLNNGDIILPNENLLTGLYVNNQGFAAFGLKLIGEFNDKFGLNIGLGGAFAGNNVAKAPAISFGLYHKF